jgi:hypothetical protein
LDPWASPKRREKRGKNKIAGIEFMAFKSGSNARIINSLMLNRKPNPMAMMEERKKAVKTSENVILKGSIQSPELINVRSLSSTRSGWGRRRLETERAWVMKAQAKMISAKKNIWVEIFFPN